MGLSNDLLYQFAKMAKPEQETSKETTVQGVAKVEHDGVIFVQLDGSDRWTPVSTTVDVKDGEKVNVMVKDHTATITGNISSPSARTDDVKENSDKLSEFAIIIAKKVDVEQLAAQVARIDSLAAKDVEISGMLSAGMAEIEKLHGKDAEFEGSFKAAEGLFGTLFADVANIKVLQADFAKIKDLEATNLKVNNLDATYGEFEVLTTNKFKATDASIKNLETNKLNASDAEIKYANIDFANINEAALEKIFAESGLIANLIVESGMISGELVGVTIKGDLIEAGTLVADKLVIKDSKDGLYYKLNFTAGEFTDAEEVPTDKLHGSVIAAKSITAEQIRASDLVAFGATIGGFNIGQRALYSGVKQTIDNSTAGVYIGADGQINIGGGGRYIKYYKESTIAKLVEYNAETNEYIVTVNNVNAETISKDLTISQVKLGSARLLEYDQNVGEYVTRNEALYLAETSDGETFYFCDRSIYRLEVSADSVVFGSSGRTVGDLEELADTIKIGKYTDPDTGIEKPSVELEDDDSYDKLLLTNDTIIFKDNKKEGTEVSKDSIVTDTLTVNKEFRQGSLAWGFRGNGNYGLMWKGANN